nr:adenylate/guanylate cyclase domain-containing protein [Actinomycetota bacterium]
MDRRLPSGIVTFLFTDIEGSTRLFHRLGDRYVGLLDRHRRIIEDAVDTAGGVEISVEGDSVFAAFGRADDALAASRDAQRRLALETWPDGVSVRVRMGIHSGLASPREGDYVALAVHQANRVMAAGHGGQVLVSADTAALLSTPQEILPLGRYRLRDFDEPLHLYQLAVEGSDGDFPAIRAIPADGHNLARPLTATIGRDDLIAGVAEELVPGRLVTLIGPGGVGKTRVAVDIGIRIAPEWADGVWRVDLAEIAEPSLVASA